MKPDTTPFVIKPLILTTAKEPWFHEELDLVQKVMAQMENCEVAPFRHRFVDIDPVVYESQDGVIRMSQKWFNDTYTKKYAAEFNFLILHITRAERDFFGLHPTINGTYWRDDNRYLECWISADEGTYPSRNRTRTIEFEGEEYDITEFQRLVLHEGGHAATHFSGRREEVKKKYNLAYQPTHYFDYDVRDVGLLYQEVSFKPWSMQIYILSLIKQILDLLTLKTPPAVIDPAPVEPPPVTEEPSLLKSWALAIQDFEDYVKPGDKYRDGTVAPNGSLSFRHKNPGNLRWSPYQSGQAKGFAYFDTYEQGFDALLHQLRIAVEGRSTAYSPNMTLLEFFQKYAPSSDNNHPQTYANYVAMRLGVDVDTVISNLA